MRILVVEDNNQLVGLLTKALARAGLDVDAASNAAAAQALPWCMEQPPWSVHVDRVPPRPRSRSVTL